MKDLFEYNNDSNIRLLDLLLTNKENLPEKSISLINHIINAHEIWNARILNYPSVGVWDVRPLHELHAIHQNNHLNSIKILFKFDLNQTISYSNSKGEIFENTVRDILIHIVNHSTYHRAQIATYLKQHGISTINTDYIFYKRK